MVDILRSSMKKGVGLALSGGAVRGIAHIAVLEVLVYEGIPVRAMAGTINKTTGNPPAHPLAETDRPARGLRVHLHENQVRRCANRCTDTTHASRISKAK